MAFSHSAAPATVQPAAIVLQVWVWPGTPHNGTSAATVTFSPAQLRSAATCAALHTLLSAATVELTTL